ncbi:MAG: lipoprotein-releasing system permease protein [Gammaproteobacteria bacterium]
MFRPLPVFIGLRYVRARRRNGFISFISFSSLIGIALGVTVLITVLSVMNGFEREVRGRILSMTAHATISGMDGTLREDWRELSRRAAQSPHVLGVAPYIQRESMLTRGTLVRGALLRGLDPQHEPRVSDITQFMKQGALDSLQPRQFNVILGIGLARALNAQLGSKVTVVAPQAVVTPAGVAPRLKRFTVSGIFEAEHGQYDGSLALIHLDDAATLFRYEEGIGGLRLKLDNPMLAPWSSRDVAAGLGGSYWVVDWTQLNANWFRALRLEKTMMFLILTLIIAVAAFNIVSTLIMAVTDKRADIAILRTLGASPASILGIFMVQGTFIGFAGTLLGLLGGVSLANNVETLVPRLEEFLGAKILPAQVYYITEVPSDLQWPDVTVICVVAFTLTLLATLYPAWSASRTQPAEALRYE